LIVSSNGAWIVQSVDDSEAERGSADLLRINMHVPVASPPRKRRRHMALLDLLTAIRSTLPAQADAVVRFRIGERLLL
jgi:hypothetical protein